MRQYRYWKAMAWERFDTRTLLSLFMAVLLAGLWSITMLQLQRAHDAAITDAGREARSMARVFDEHAIRTIEAADQAVTYLRGRYQALGNRLDIVADLQQGLNPGPLYNLFTIVDERGDTVLSSRPFKPTNLETANTSGYTCSATAANCISASRCWGACRKNGRSR